MATFGYVTARRGRSSSFVTLAGRSGHGSEATGGRAVCAAGVRQRDHGGHGHGPNMADATCDPGPALRLELDGRVGELREGPWAAEPRAARRTRWLCMSAQLVGDTRVVSITVAGRGPCTM